MSKELSAEELAVKFHTLYEELAPQFYYTTRRETRQFNKDSQNGKLMIAVCNKILETYLKVGVREKNEKLKERCEAAEAILKKYYKRIPDCPELITWVQLSKPG